MNRTLRTSEPAATLLPRRKRHFGIQTFSEIIEEGYHYVDKSAFAVRGANEGKYCCLSHPRRFGKRFFLDALEALFAGRESLFKCLAAAKVWDWSDVCEKYILHCIDDNGRVLEMREGLKNLYSVPKRSEELRK